MDLSGLRLQAGSRCRVRTEVLALGGLVVLHPPMPVPVALAGHAPGRAQPPRTDPLDVPATGVDLGALGERLTSPDGAWVRGLAEVRGTWGGDHLAVDAQSPLTSEQLDGPAREAVRRRARTAPRRRDRSADHPPAVLRDAEAVMVRRMGPWLAWSVGTATDVTGRPVVTAAVVRVVDELARWAADLPDGALELDVWLTPDPAG